MAAQLVRWDPELSITALRFTNIVGADEYDSFERAGSSDYRRDLLWSYVDARDGALAVSLALSAAQPGFEIYNVAASDTGNDVPSAELAAEFPGVPITKQLGEYETPRVDRQGTRTARVRAAAPLAVRVPRQLT